MMLADLPDVYKPMIMGIQSSGFKMTGASIKITFLQDVKIKKKSNDMSFLGNFQSNELKFKKKTSPNRPKCYNCEGIGHISTQCPSKKKNSTIFCVSHKKKKS